jgi:hypothetical protein
MVCTLYNALRKFYYKKYEYIYNISWMSLCALKILIRVSDLKAQLSEADQNQASYSVLAFAVKGSSLQLNSGHLLIRSELSD